MISFQPTEEQAQIRDAMHDFAENALRPAARDSDESGTVADDLLQQAWELGLTTIQVPIEYGGMGGDRSPISNAIAIEELAWGDASLAATVLAPAAFVNALLDHGTEEQKSSLLPGLCGEKFTLGALAVVEPGMMTDASAPATRAEQKSDHFILNGTKRVVPFGDRATHFMVTADSATGLGAYIVERGAAGVKVSDEAKNLGLRALPTSTLELQNVEVAPSGRLGGEGGANVRRILDSSRVGIAAALTGLAKCVVDYCVPYAKDRVAFDEAIAKKQAIAFALAESHIEVEAMRWLTWQGASQLEQGKDATKGAGQAYMYAAKKGLWVADNGIQTLGGHGFIREHPVEMWFRHARTLGVLEGTMSV